MGSSGVAVALRPPEVVTADGTLTVPALPRRQQGQTQGKLRAQGSQEKIDMHELFPSPVVQMIEDCADAPSVEAPRALACAQISC